MNKCIGCLTLILALACQRAPEVPATKAPAPPAQRDRWSEVRQVPVGDLAQPNPAPQKWMLGCFDVVISGIADNEWTPPKAVRLTSDPRRGDPIKQRYSIVDRTSGRDATLWSWTPVASDEVEASIGTGFVGWTFRLHETPKGMQGSARFWTDTGDPEPHSHIAEFFRTPCK